MSPARLVDATGMRCPVPVHLLARAVARGPAGVEVTLLADDPLAAVDVPAWCHDRGMALEEAARDAGGWRFRVRVPGPPGQPAAGSPPAAR